MNPLETCVLRYLNEFCEVIVKRYQISENDLKNIFFF
jgi:hypothetical protein